MDDIVEQKLSPVKCMDDMIEQKSSSAETVDMMAAALSSRPHLHGLQSLIGSLVLPVPSGLHIFNFRAKHDLCETGRAGTIGR